MNIMIRTAEFDTWLRQLKDAKGKARILARLRSAEQGNFGDCEPVGQGISEMRIHTGSGYRVYYTLRDNVIYLLVNGGDKSTQSRDIKHAKQLLATLENKK